MASTSKPKPPDGSAGVRAEGPSNLKHEREEDENPAPRQRRRTSVKIETVDLTEGQLQLYASVKLSVAWYSIVSEFVFLLTVLLQALIQL